MNAPFTRLRAIFLHLPAQTVILSVLLLLTFTSAYRTNQLNKQVSTIGYELHQALEQQKIMQSKLTTILAYTSQSQPAVTQPSGDPAADIFIAPPENADAQSKLDTVKKRYEEILVTYMYLQRCKLSKPEDFHMILSAFSQELASLRGPARLQYDTLTAAKGSYEGVYAATPCDLAKNNELLEQYNNFIQILTEQYGYKVP
jgi:hypothetical protein